MATSTVVIVLSLIAVSFLWAVLFGGRLPKVFHNRTCQGKGWRNAFPDSTKQDIREFLSLFVDAFAIASKEKLKLNPNDQILQIYRAIYPSKLTPDALEVETLARDIETKYGFTLESIWHEQLTLGELFQVTQRVSAS
jgi:propanediol dehydratase small subunit